VKVERMEVEQLRDYLMRGAVLVVQVTPFDRNGNIDFEALRFNTEVLIEKRHIGPLVLIPAGSTGEHYTLSDDEWRKVVKTVVDAANGKVPVIAGAHRAGTKWTIEHARYAEDIGADGVMTVLPYYHVPMEEGLYRHYKLIADSIGIGLLIYNNPDVSKIYIKPHLMRHLVQAIPNLVGVKENTPYVWTFYEQVKAVEGRIPIIQGRGEAMYVPTVVLGAKGFVSGYANFMPEFCLELLKAGEALDVQRLRSLLEKLYVLEAFISEMNNKYGPSTTILPPPYTQGCMVYAVIKAAMNILGYKGGHVRLPLIDIRDEDVKRLEKILIEHMELKPIE